MKLFWPTLTFPPINLWNVPLLNKMKAGKSLPAHRKNVLPDPEKLEGLFNTRNRG